MEVALEQARLVWKWEASYVKAFWESVPDAQLKAKLNDELKKQISNLVGVEGIKSVRVVSVNHSVKWESWFYLLVWNYKATGTTTAVIEAEATPIAWAAVALFFVKYVLPSIIFAIIAWFVLETFKTVSFTITKLAEEAPWALGLILVAVILLAAVPIVKEVRKHA